MIMLKNNLLYTESSFVTDYQACFMQAVKVQVWLRNKRAYAISFNQLGFSERCFVIRKPKKLQLTTSIIMNPTFTPKDNAKEIIMEEQCLSFPRQTFKIKRYDNIVVSFYDYAKQKEVTIELDGIASVVFQHEISHLDGKPDDVICIKDDKK